jgi:hypothetical protein
MAGELRIGQGEKKYLETLLSSQFQKSGTFIFRGQNLGDDVAIPELLWGLSQTTCRGCDTTFYFKYLQC